MATSTPATGAGTVAPEDTRLTSPRKLGILVIAIAWAGAITARLFVHRPPPGKKHGNPAKCVFRIGFEHLQKHIGSGSRKP